MKYITNFETTAAYEAAENTLATPNVSLTRDNMNVHYKPWVETRVVAKYNVTDASSPTQIISQDASSPFSAIEIDGVQQPSVVTSYTFSTLGEHTVKYTLTDPTSTGLAAFMDCRGLTSIVIPDSVTNIEQYGFYDCNALTSITIPNSVTTIGNYAFDLCSSLTSINIPSGVTSIGSGAFAGCSNFTSIDIPDSVTSIGSNAFDLCSSLTSIIVRRETPPTLDYGYHDTFNSTNNCPIYVPSGSVNAYKSASGWSDYASRIQAIP